MMKGSDFMKYILTTYDGDVWVFDTLEEAQRNQWIFGGKIDYASVKDYSEYLKRGKKNE